MAEYIERDYNECITKHRAKHFVCEFCNEHCSDEPCEPGDCEWMQYIENEPAADVAPVVHGRWEQKKHKIFGNSYDYMCSVCGCDYALAEYNYCPNRGAKMDGGKNDAAD